MVDRRSRSPRRLGIRVAALAGLVLLQSFLTVTADAQAPAAPLRLDDVLDLAQFADRQPIDLSPDGRYVAAALVRPGRAAALQEPYASDFTRSGVPVYGGLGGEIWLTDVRSRTSSKVSGDAGSAWAPAWSPDGRVLAFYTDRDGAARLWLWDRERQTTRRASDAIVRPYFGFEAPRWSADGARLLVKLLPEGMSLEQAAALLPQPPRPPGAGARTAPGDTAVVAVFASDPALLDSASGGRPNTPGTDQPRTDAFNRYLSDLAVIHVASGRVDRIARRAKPLAYAFSPDGRRVLYTDARWIEEQGRGRVAYSLIVMSLDGGDTHVVARDTLGGYGQSASWEPRSTRVAYVDLAGALVVAGADGPDTPVAQWRRIARFVRPGVSFRTDYAAPLWSEDGRRLFLTGADTLWEASVDGGRLRAVGTAPGRAILGLVADVRAGRMWAGPDGGSAIVVTRDTLTHRIGFVRLPLAGGAPQPLWHGDVAVGGDLPYALDVSPAGVVAFVAEQARHPQEVWVGSDGLRSARRASALHPAVGRVRFGESRLVTWTSARGQRLRGALLLPPDYTPGRRYPVIVRVYSGATRSARVNRFGIEAPGAENLQLIATRGYAVLVPDLPRSGGRPVDDVAGAVLPALDHLVAVGIADPRRFGVTGQSDGGYATMALLTRTDRFAAAISVSGDADLLGDYLHLRADGSSPGIARVEGYGAGMGGPPWGERLGRYIEQSPIYQLDRVTTPLLLVHGDADEIIPSAASGRIFVGLRRLGKPAVLAIYQGEGHGMSGWSRASLEDYWHRVWAWWDRWLGAR